MVLAKTSIHDYARGPRGVQRCQVSRSPAAVQLFIVRAWMSRFSMGPVEWLWRTATQLKRQPLVLPARA